MLVSIAVGYIKKINIGYFAIAFSYLIGAFLLGYTPRKIIGMWPTNFFSCCFRSASSTDSLAPTAPWMPSLCVLYTSRVAGPI